MLAAIINQMLVDLISKGISVIFLTQGGNEAQLFQSEHFSAGILRSIDDNSLGFRVEGPGKDLFRQTEIRQVQRHVADLGLG